MEPSCSELKVDTVTLSAAEWAGVRSAFQRLTALENPLLSYLRADKSRQTASGARIRNTVMLAWCELHGAVTRAESERWLQRQLATLNIEDDDADEEED
jgi:hypothetical protein